MDLDHIQHMILVQLESRTPLPPLQRKYLLADGMRLQCLVAWELILKLGELDEKFIGVIQAILFWLSAPIEPQIGSVDNWCLCQCLSDYLSLYFSLSLYVYVYIRCAAHQHPFFFPQTQKMRIGCIKTKHILMP